MFSTLFNELLHRPLVNLLVFLYEKVTFYDLGLAIIALTIVIRIILFPLFHKLAHHQRMTQKIQPHIKKLQETHKDSKEAQTKAIMALYGEHKINPLTPIFLLLLQLPILIALYNVFRDGFSEKALASLYTFVSEPASFIHTFLGFIDLNASNLLIVLIATGLQYIQGMVSAPKPGGDPQMAKLARNMLFIGPGITLVILWNLPSALGLYWLTSTAFSIFQQRVLDKKLDAPEPKKEIGAPGAK